MFCSTFPASHNITVSILELLEQGLHWQVLSVARCRDIACSVKQLTLPLTWNPLDSVRVLLSRDISLNGVVVAIVVIVVAEHARWGSWR